MAKIRKLTIVNRLWTLVGLSIDADCFLAGHERKADWGFCLPDGNFAGAKPICAATCQRLAHTSCLSSAVLVLAAQRYGRDISGDIARQLSVCHICDAHF